MIGEIDILIQGVVIGASIYQTVRKINKERDEIDLRKIIRDSEKNKIKKERKR